MAKNKHRARGSYDETGYDFWCDEDPSCTYRRAFVNGETEQFVPGEENTYHVVEGRLERREDRLKIFEDSLR